MNPFEVLGLEEESANPKAIRGAYARLLQVHPPDKDPEGFRRLREAYETALAWAQYRSWEEDPVPDESPPPAATNAPEPEPDLSAIARRATADPIDALEAPFLEAGAREDLLAIAARALTLRFRADPELAPAWSTLLSRHLADSPRALLGPVEIDDLIVELDHGCADVASLWLWARARDGDMRQVVELGERIVVRDRLDAEFGEGLAWFLFEIAAAVAILDPGLARQLCGRARERETGSDFDEVDRLVSAGFEMQEAPVAARAYLASIAVLGEWRDDHPGYDEAVAALGEADPDGPMRTWLADSAPGLLDRIPLHAGPTPPEAQTGDEKLGCKTLWAAAVLVVFLLRECVFDDERPKFDPPEFDPTELENLRRRLERLKDLRPVPPIDSPPNASEKK